MKFQRLRILSILIPASLLPLVLHAQHGHLNAGAQSQENGSQLYFVNGDAFVTNSGYVVNLAFTNSGKYAGYYQGGFTPTALPATAENGGPAFGHAAPGSFLEMQIESVIGPADGTFGFWEETNPSPVLSLPAGTSDSTNRFRLSESDGAAGSDPFGHVHGRRFTATTPGLYTVAFRILDASTNGPSGGPIHTPSDRFPIFFQAGTTIASIALDPQGTILAFATRTGQSYQIESALRADNPDGWEPLSDPVEGDDHLHTIVDARPADATRFYRLRVILP